MVFILVLLHLLAFRPASTLALNTFYPGEREEDLVDPSVTGLDEFTYWKRADLDPKAIIIGDDGCPLNQIYCNLSDGCCRKSIETCCTFGCCPNGSGCSPDGCRFANGTAVTGSYCGEGSYACDFEASPNGGCCPLGQVCISPSGCQDYVPPVSSTSEPVEPTTVIRTEFQVSTIVRATTVSNIPSPTTPASPSKTLQTSTAPTQVTQGGNLSIDATTPSAESTQGTVASNVGGMPTGVIIGIAIGCSLVGLLVGGLLLFCLFQRWKRKQGGAGRRSSVAKPPQELHGSSYLDPNFTAPDRYGNSGWGPSEYSTQSQQTWHELSATPRVPQVRSDNSQELGGLDTQR